MERRGHVVGVLLVVDMVVHACVSFEARACRRVSHGSCHMWGKRRRRDCQDSSSREAIYIGGGELTVGFVG